MEISHNFCINTRVGKVGFFLEKNPTDPNHTHPLSKKCHRSDPKCCFHSRGERLPGQKGFSYLLSLCFPSPTFTLAQPVGWAKQRSSMVHSWGIKKVLLGLCSVCPLWRERAKQLLLQTSPNAALFFMPLFDQANPHKSSNTTVSVPSAVWWHISIASVSVTAKGRQAGLLFRETPITIMIC